MTEVHGIYTKLLKFQALGITVKKDADNPYYSSRYVTLNEVLDKVKAPLTKMGVLILQEPQADGLRTMLIDTEDGSNVVCFMPYVETTTAQKLGSCNTYNRRYSLVTLLGLEDVDDDGNVASSPSVKPSQSPDLPRGATIAPKKVSTPISAPQRALLTKLLSERGLAAHGIETMTKDEASKRINQLLQPSFEGSTVLVPPTIQQDADIIADELFNQS